ncbi:MAG: thiamine-binding protein [Bacteroidales bacterium]
MNHKVNIAIQVLPTTEKTHPYEMVDKAINVIINSGHNYIVCPFETVVECSMDEALKLIADIHHECYQYDTNSMLVNIKIHSHKNKDAAIDDKMAKYK